MIIQNRLRYLKVILRFRCLYTYSLKIAGTSSSLSSSGRRLRCLISPAYDPFNTIFIRFIFIEKLLCTVVRVLDVSGISNHVTTDGAWNLRKEVKVRKRVFHHVSVLRWWSTANQVLTVIFLYHCLLKMSMLDFEWRLRWSATRSGQLPGFNGEKM